MNTVKVIEKEKIPFLKFSKDDVLPDPAERSKRYYNVNRATILGNAFHNKASITFQTEQGDVNKVETTVWANDDTFVMLKSGAFLPLRSIVKVEHC